MHVRKLSLFLRRHAIHVDESRLHFVMKKMPKRRSLHDILQEAGCPVDNKLAESLEFSIKNN
ncbi:MAG: hypothetical protein HYW25_05045 [Candidatus Aenigmarchaeota archaeon]|nr:hypothetical protein [Candidatus Aenigmarchaeota archaeon]